MFGRFMPQEGKFFDLFNAHADQIVAGGKSLVALMSAVLSKPESAKQYAEEIDRFENKADEITRNTLSLLHSTFITPFDRDEIHQLIGGMDDILDLIQDVAESMALYDIQEVTEEARLLAEQGLACCEKVRYAVGLLNSMDNAGAILKTCQEIDALETEADRTMRGAMSRLFREESDIKQLIKLKAIYELLETVTDRCEDVANILEGIVLENS